MPIINRQDAEEVDQYIRRFFDPGASRAQALRRLFVEKLDFASATGAVTLAKAPKNVALPPSAERIASMEGLHVVYVPLSGSPSPDRVRKAEASAAAKLIADELHGDLLLVMTNPSCSQLHVIWPTFRFDKLTTSTGASPSLRRMIVERDLPRRTAVQQLSNIYWKWKETDSIGNAVEKAFDVDAVTKQFFEEYRRVFDYVIASVKGFGPGETEEEAKKLFVQTLFNRLMFIYFLSRKGWLAFDRDKDYLKALWRAHEARADGNKNFYADRLRLLFSAGLNNSKSQDLTSESESRRLIGIVPFLNGGLFDRTDEDNRTRVLVPDDCIQEILAKLFDRFNFTVMESTPFDVEVAVDPEMLGKVFEELVTGRHESGSYYTPRPVVAFMCREALKGYLETQNTEASVEAIAAFVDHKDTAKLTLSSAPKIGEALARMKVVDPACGSGAYLLGMMQELVELMTTLYSAQLSHEALDLYKLKLDIIRKNLYGADIDRFAVNIAMLRLWLSLAIEYDGDVAKLPPLPNLDFKIVCGDSLLGPDPSPENYGTLFRHRVHQLAGQLAALKERHMREPGPQKERFSNDIKALKKQLREALADSPAAEGVVDWRVEFGEVFEQNHGFDVVIANPPYVTRTDIGMTSTKAILGSLYPEATTGMSDLYCYFYARGLQLLRPKGMHVFVCSNTWLDVGFGAKLQEFLLKNSWIRSIYESQLEKQFSTAEINTLISVISRETPSATSITRFVALHDSFSDGLAVVGNKSRVISVANKELWEAGQDDDTRRQRYVGERWGGKYLRAPDIYHAVLSKGKLVPVSQYASARLGITTGANEFFFVEKIAPGTYCTYVTGKREQFSLREDYARPVIRSVSDCEKVSFMAKDTSWYIVTLPKDIHEQSAREYVRLAESIGIHKRPFFKDKKTWYVVNSLPDDTIAVPEIIYTRYFFLWNGDNIVLNKNFYGYQLRNITADLLWAILNCTFTFLQFELNSRKPGAGASGISVKVANRIGVAPVADLGTEEKNVLIEEGQKLLVGPILQFDKDILRPERRMIDEVLFKRAGLSQLEMDSIYESYVGLIEARVTKAKSR